MEVFSPPRMAPVVEKLGAPLGVRSSWDRKVGWGSSSKEDVKQLWKAIRSDRPEMIWLRSECRAFSAINRINRDRMDPADWGRLMSEGLRDLILCMEIASYQVRHGRNFAFEHPLYASSWGTFVL
eukprot:4410872-Pyramimonas_sp.AAC.1